MKRTESPRTAMPAPALAFAFALARALAHARAMALAVVAALIGATARRRANYEYPTEDVVIY